MFPYQLEAQEETRAAAPAPRRRIRRAGQTALIALALAGGTAGGGVAGVLAANRWGAPREPQTAVVAAQPIAQTAPTNVAGAVLQAAGPSVVEVNVQGAVARGGFSPSGSGSGFVVDASGLILTNQHVVADTNNLSVQFSNGETRTATVVGSDRTNDLALLRVDNVPSGIPALALADSDDVEVGETAIAIGSPFGLEQTVTQGIISAVDRNWSPEGRLLRGLLQTDAPINPGNSGGPLLNADGEVIGINTLIESPVRGNVGVGFAVPSNVARQQLDQLKAGANLQQGYMGISAQESTDPNQQGVTIGAVEQGSGAAQAGLRVGDVIVAIDGTRITGFEDLVGQITGKQPGAKVTLTIQRGDQEQEIEVTLQARAEQPVE